MVVLKKLVLGTLGGVNSGLNKVYEGFNKDTEFTKVNPVKLLTSGKIDASDIGKTVYLSNSATVCQEWQVADINHDNTSGTVDLFSKYVLDNGNVNSTIRFAYEDQDYSQSLVRSWLNNDLYNAFTDEIKDAMKVQSFTYYHDLYGNYDVSISDKVKCPSVKEVGCRYGATGIGVFALTSDEGNIYPIFGNQQLQYNSLAIRSNQSNNWYHGYWTRSLAYNSMGEENYAIMGSLYDISAVSSKFNVGHKMVAIIRF